MTNVEPLPGQKILCPRCGHVLARYSKDPVTKGLALSITGLFLILPALFLDLVTFNKLGLSEGGNVFQTVAAFIEQEFYFVALVVFLGSMFFPLLKLALLFSVTLSLKLKKYFPALPTLFKLYCHLDEWAMLEVYLLGILVTVIKMYHSTDIVFNTGFYCFIALVFIIIAASHSVNKKRFWKIIEETSPLNDHHHNKIIDKIVPKNGTTAAANNLMTCHDCEKLLPIVSQKTENTQKCPRCGSAVHLRKPRSIERTWALILAATIFLFPANLLPIMRVDFLGIPSNSTILDGIILFFQDGSYGIAFIILLASVLIPIFKVVGLSIVLLTIRLNRARHLRQKIIMFRIIEFIGRWSMLDIFVIAVLGAFINFGFLTTIESASGATYFCLVVITTMFGALAFDPRLMWDIENYQQQEE